MEMDEEGETKGIERKDMAFIALVILVWVELVCICGSVSELGLGYTAPITAGIIAISAGAVALSWECDERTGFLIYRETFYASMYFLAGLVLASVAK